jgi:hypothetical protein
MKLVFHISEDGSEIELKHWTVASTLRIMAWRRLWVELL